MPQSTARTRLLIVFAATWWLTQAVRADNALDPPAGLKVKPAVTFKAQPFALHDVRLLDGPFRQALQRDRQYLLRRARGETG